MPENEHQSPSLVERIQRALVLLAYFIELDGDIHIAMYEKFEKELEALKQRESTKARARHLLMAYSELANLQIGAGQVSSQFTTDTVQHGSFAAPIGRVAQAVVK